MHQWENCESQWLHILSAFTVPPQIPIKIIMPHWVIRRAYHLLRSASCTGCHGPMALSPRHAISDSDNSMFGRVRLSGTQFYSDVMIIESKSKIAILARNRIGSKSQFPCTTEQFPCTTEMILSIVAFAHSRCRAVMRYRSHQCSAGARTCLSSAAGERWVTAAGLKCDCGRGVGERAV